MGSKEFGSCIICSGYRPGWGVCMTFAAPSWQRGSTTAIPHQSSRKIHPPHCRMKEEPIAKDPRVFSDPSGPGKSLIRSLIFLTTSREKKKERKKKEELNRCRDDQ